MTGLQTFGFINIGADVKGNKINDCDWIMIREDLEVVNV